MGQQDKSVRQEIIDAAALVAKRPGDTSNAAFFAALYRDRLAYVHAWGEWLVWDGTRWRRDDAGRVVKLAKRAVLKMHRLSMYRGFPRKLRAALREQSVITERREQKLKAMIRLAESELPVSPADLDRDPWLLNTESGTIDLQTGELREHNPADRITKLASVKFDPDVPCPAWEKFIAAVLPDPDTRRFFRNMCGYALTGSVREQLITFLYGSGANGKTTAINTVMEVLGKDYGLRAAPGLVMVKPGDAHPTSLADLFGCRLAFVSETERGRHLNETFVKDVTGGDSIRARRMRQDNFEFSPTHKIVVATNYLPEVRGTDNGIWRRVRIVPFTRTFWNPDTDAPGPDELRQDKSLPSKLRAEASGILNWLLAGCRDWLAADGLPASLEMLRVCGDYRAAQDTVGQFLADCTAPAPAHKVGGAALYTAYKAHAAQLGAEPVSSVQFAQEVTVRGFEKKRGSDGVRYMGLRLV